MAVQQGQETLFEQTAALLFCVQKKEKKGFENDARFQRDISSLDRTAVIPEQRSIRNSHRAKVNVAYSIVLTGLHTTRVPSFPI